MVFLMSIILNLTYLLLEPIYMGENPPRIETTMNKVARIYEL